MLLMTLAVAALAVAAIFMASSAGLLSRFYDRERTFGLAAESALEIARSRLQTDQTLAVPDTGMVQLLSGWTPADADGGSVGGVSVNVYAAATGDTTGVLFPIVTLIAASYDANGTRHVRRMDLQRESFSRYQYFVDSFPSGQTHGPGVVGGRVHSNGNWLNSASGNRFLDTVTVVGTVSGTATFEIDSLVDVVRIPFPQDSTFPRLDTLALNAGLRFAPLWGSGRGSRMAFVAFDADDDGVIEAAEGFFKVFDIAVGRDTTYLRVNPAVSYHAWTGNTYLSWDDPRIQNQCGASYLRGGRWHFFPISTHRATWARAVIQATGASNFPAVNPATMNGLDDYDWEAARDVMAMETARCFPAGSSYLMTAERMTDATGVVTGTAADTVPFGVITPPGGWPASAPNGYGGNDSTFTIRSRTCTFSTGGTSGRCNSGTIADLGEWRAGTNPSGISANARQSVEAPYLWAYGTAYNSLSRGVVSVITNPVYVGGVITGAVTLRASSRVAIVGDLTYANAPNDPDGDCGTMLGVLAVGDVLVVEASLNRLRRYGNYQSFFVLNSFGAHLGNGRRTALQGSFMSLTGTVGVESPSVTMGTNTWQLECPEDAGSSTRSNGGCLELTGGAVMKRYSSLHSGANTGMRYHGIPDRCQSASRRPPFFPLTNRYTHVRTLEVEASLANNPAKIRTLLMRLKGKSL
ncbi:MAG: hypothetical protein WD771_02660 [Gemmatimonadaceae bacterium]